ncbi:hypothetical protein J4526_02040 [Desulfurococcaceae archaeon MEX13E-LK6-19]|nr:hypothetical protein J4526_02040 [Desulfurococcaceae archaeon MEX13E-LK6-19]
MERKPTRKEVIAVIASRKPWLIPLIYTIYSLGGSAKLEEIKEILSLRSIVLKRGLWWLQKFGIATRKNDKVVMDPEYKKVLDELFMDICKTRNYYILKFGATYLVVSVKRTRISSYTVPAQLVEELAKMVNNVSAEFTPKDLAEAMGIPPKLAYRVVKTRKLLIECSKK